MVEAVVPQGTIALGTGYNYDDPSEGIEFAGDWRPMSHLAEAITEDGPQIADIEDWQITRRYARDHRGN